MLILKKQENRNSEAVEKRAIHLHYISSRPNKQWRENAVK